MPTDATPAAAQLERAGRLRLAAAASARAALALQRVLTDLGAGSVAEDTPRWAAGLRSVGLEVAAVAAGWIAAAEALESEAATMGGAPTGSAAGRTRPAG